MTTRFSDLMDIWECPSCNESFDLYWILQRDVCWFPKDVSLPDVFPEYENLLSLAFSTPHDCLAFDLCLCCDLTQYTIYDKTDFDKCQALVDDYIIEETPADYLRANKLSYLDIYDRTISDCFNCQFYLSPGCIPLRNVIRFHNGTDTLPASNLITCSRYIPKSFPSASAQEKSNGHNKPIVIFNYEE